VTEAIAPDMSMFGEEGLEAELAGLQSSSPEAIVLAIQAAVDRFANGAEQADDITVLAARWLGSQPATTAVRKEFLPVQPQV
jgi:sigma-B regulation protein RsbU (phosphoserine phosphatase)